jgi:hypothetical protein
MLDINSMLGNTPNPGTAIQLAESLRQLDQLRGANVSTAPITNAGTHETGHIALGTQVLEHLAPHLAAPVTATLGGLEFAKLGAFKRLLSGPTQEAADELASQTKFADFQKMAKSNPKLSVYRNYLQGAFGEPGALGTLPSPADSQ